MCAVIGVCTDIYGDLTIAQRTALSHNASGFPGLRSVDVGSGDSRTGRRSTIPFMTQKDKCLGRQTG